ncbi:MAG: hypothetical protein ACREV7_04385 [Steroidobacteraceae bacterium]
MRTKVTKDLSQRALARILDAFAQELIDASDEEVLEAAKDLGMDPDMKWSAAFAGVIYPSSGHLQLSDFFDLEELKKALPVMAGRDRVFSEVAVKEPVKTKVRSRRTGRRRLSSQRKPSNGT